MHAYNPYAPSNARQGQGRIASKTMTSVGLLMRLYNGMDKTSEIAERGALYLGENLPSIRRTKDASLRDTYYWYYATQFMYHMGGQHWKQWNDRLHPCWSMGRSRKAIWLEVGIHDGQSLIAGGPMQGDFMSPP